jgi:hypothetical protein
VRNGFASSSSPTSDELVGTMPRSVVKAGGGELKRSGGTARSGVTPDARLWMAKRSITPESSRITKLFLQDPFAARLSGRVTAGDGKAGQWRAPSPPSTTPR